MEKHTLLLLHGGPGFDSSYFFPYLSPLKEHLEIVTYTLGSNAKGYTLDSLLDEYEYELSKLNGKSFSILAHSFSSFLALSKPSIKRMGDINKIFLSNWIYDQKWIDEFNENEGDVDGELPESLKELCLHYVKKYFKDTDRGKEVLNGIQYNDRLQEEIGPHFFSIELRKEIECLSERIVSISSDYDRITSKDYIKKICDEKALRNYLFTNSGHFPFVEETSKFNSLILKEMEILI